MTSSIVVPVTTMLHGGDGDDAMYGGTGDDTLDGGAGSDTYNDNSGNNTYLLGRESGQDTLTNNYDTTAERLNTIQLAADVLAGDVTVSQTGLNLVVAINGTTDQLTVTKFFYNPGYEVQQIRFADGTIWDPKAFVSPPINGTNAADTLNGLSRNDAIQGQGGDDLLYGLAGNDLLNGGAGNDVLDGGVGNNFLMGGIGDDSIVTGTGSDVVALNRGDGQDTMTAGTGKDNAISLGNGIGYADLFFTKTANDLILTTGANEQVTFKDWYVSADNHSVANLQMVIEGSADYDVSSTDALHNRKIVQFNFNGLVTAFDQARAATPTLTSWALSSSLLNFYLNSSDTAAIGGDLAYQYAKNGNLSTISMMPAQALLASAQFGSAGQELQLIGLLQDSSPLLM